MTSYYSFYVNRLWTWAVSEFRMNAEARTFIKMHLQVKLERDPDPSEVMNWILESEEQTFNFSEVNPITLKSFIQSNVKKLKETGTLERKKRSGRNGAISKAQAARIRKLSINKKRRSTRKVAAMVGVSKRTVSNVLKRDGAKPYHRRRVQAMKPEHMVRRVQFATWTLAEYGQITNGNSICGRLVNTDFSAMVRLNGTLNTKNNIIWSHSIQEAGDMDYQGTREQ